MPRVSRRYADPDVESYSHVPPSGCHGWAFYSSAARMLTVSSGLISRRYEKTPTVPSRRRPPARPVAQVPDIVEAGFRKNELPVDNDVAVVPGIEHRAVDRHGDMVGVEEHLAVVVVVDDRTEPVPDIAVGLRSCVERQHLSVVEDTAPPPAERFIPFFHREERLVGRCRLLATEFGNIPEKWDGLPPPALGLGEEGTCRTVPLQVRNRPPELADEILLDGVAPPSRPVPETLGPDPCAGMVRLRVIEDVRGLGAPGVGDMKIVPDKDVTVEKIGQVTSSLPETRCTRDRERCALPYRQEPGPRRRNPVGARGDCRAGSRPAWR